MCLITFGWQHWPSTPLFLIANRDEFHARPTAAMHWWEGQNDGVAILAGRDLQAGGSWLGVSARGKFAALTNFRETPALGKPVLGKPVLGKKSRGELVSEFLRGPATAAHYAAKVAEQGETYAGFNLLLADEPKPGQQLFYVSNRSQQPPQMLPPGIYSLSNALLDSPWPKSNVTRRRLISAGPQGHSQQHFESFADGEKAVDSELPKTGMPEEWEKLLSSPFITSPAYGTRATSLLACHADGRTSLTERRFGPSGAITGESQFRFRA